MRERAWGMVAALGLAVWGASCEDTQTCTRCPSIADSYALEFNSLSGECGFEPWLIPPTLVVGQASGADRVTLELVDPVNQLPVQLIAELRVPTDSTSETVAAFHGFQRTIRQAFSPRGELVELALSFSGAVSQKDGRRRLSLTLLTYPVFDAGCISRQTVVGTGATVP